MSQLEQMAQMFGAIEADGRRYVLVVLRAEYERVQRTRRPTLRLIHGGAQAEGIATPAPASSRRAKK